MATTTELQNANRLIEIYQSYFGQDGGGLPTVGNTDQNIVELGEACYLAVMRDRKLSEQEIAKYEQPAPEVAVV